MNKKIKTNISKESYLLILKALFELESNLSKDWLNAKSDKERKEIMDLKDKIDKAISEL